LNRILPYLKTGFFRRHKEAHAFIGAGVQQEIEIFRDKFIGHIPSSRFAFSPGTHRSTDPFPDTAYIHSNSLDF
jgi:hypothetical protein